MVLNFFRKGTRFTLLLTSAINYFLIRIESNLDKEISNLLIIQSSVNQNVKIYFT